jgi:hypothetical protein
MLLLTTHAGTPILVGQGGVTIEPELQDRSVVLMPTKEREKHKITVQESFEKICKALARAGQLIDVKDPAPSEPVSEGYTVDPLTAAVEQVTQEMEREFGPRPEPVEQVAASVDGGVVTAIETKRKARKK